MNHHDGFGGFFVVGLIIDRHSGLTSRYLGIFANSAICSSDGVVVAQFSRLEDCNCLDAAGQESCDG